MKVRVHHNGDDVFIAWKPNGFIHGCRGFELLRRRNGVEEVVSTWVGFVGDEHEEGEHRSSSDWPIQKYQWTDYMANPGDTLQYRVVPMVGPDKRTLAAAIARRATGRKRSPSTTRPPEDRGVLQSRHRRRSVGVAPAGHHRDELADDEAA